MFETAEYLRRIVFLEHAGILAEIDIEHSVNACSQPPSAPEQLLPEFLAPYCARRYIVLFQIAGLVTDLA
jgi:hypothetical protein